MKEVRVLPRLPTDFPRNAEERIAKAWMVQNRMALRGPPGWADSIQPFRIVERTDATLLENVSQEDTSDASRSASDNGPGSRTGGQHQ